MTRLLSLLCTKLNEAELGVRGIRIFRRKPYPPTQWGSYQWAGYHNFLFSINENILKCYVINRPSVATTVLQTPLSLIN